MRTVAPLAIALTLVPAAALAHGAPGVEPETPSWTFDPWIVVPLGIAAAAYAAGTLRLWARAGAGGGVRVWQAACYALGSLLLAGALLSPLHWLGEHLFTLHMVEHEIVMALAAPLIAVARPLGASVWAFPTPVRRVLGRVFRSAAVGTAWRALTQPRNATILHGMAIWIWHAPVLFDAAVTHVAVHRLQHLSFLLTALAFWWALARRSNYGAATGHLFVTMLHTTMLGALMALAPRVLYHAQTADALHWGLTPLEDQQLAGVVMWVPAGTIYAGAALAFAALWIRQSGRAPASRVGGEP